MNLKPHHIAFTVNNLDQSVKWYEDILGFKLAKTYKKGNMNIALLNKDDFYIELFFFEKETNQLPAYKKELLSDLHTIGTKHICLETENLKSVISNLKEKNVGFVTTLDSTFFGGNSIFIKDCNDIFIELYEK